MEGSQRHWRRCVWLALNTKPFDVAEYLRSADAIFYYLEAELEETESPDLARAVRAICRARDGADMVAAETGLTVEVVDRAAQEVGAGDRDTVNKVMEAYRERMSSDSQVV